MCVSGRLDRWGDPDIIEAKASRLSLQPSAEAIAIEIVETRHRGYSG
jgi:hypothetical protein